MISKSCSTSLSRLPSTSTTTLISRSFPFRQPSCHQSFSSCQTRFNSNDSRTPRLTLYTGTDCSLCDVAKQVLDQVRKEQPFELSLYNIRDDSLPDIKKWRRAYQYDIPVLHLGGEEIARHRLDKSKVLEKLREWTDEFKSN